MSRAGNILKLNEQQSEYNVIAKSLQDVVKGLSFFKPRNNGTKLTQLMHKELLDNVKKSLDMAVKLRDFED